MAIFSKPEFITFTGVDDWTDMRKLYEISAVYPIEWAMLFSKSRQGEHQRYPKGTTQSDFLWAPSIRKAAHICGAYSDAIMGGRSIAKEFPADLGYFDRVQINHHSPIVRMVDLFRREWGTKCILQCQGSNFPHATGIWWLFDQSGGTGVSPIAWPKHPGGRLHGYAGGIRPANVLSVLEAINAQGPFWIDMESGVRDENDRLDLNKCREVCEKVYGK